MYLGWNWFCLVENCGNILTGLKLLFKTMKKSLLLSLSLLPLTCCGKHGPMERVEEFSVQRQQTMGSLASLAGKEEGMVFTLKGSEHTPSFSQTKTQKNLYQNTLKAMQGYPYSVDPTGKTVYTDWFEDDQKRPTKITILVREKDVIVNVFAKHKGTAVSDRKKSMVLQQQITNG